MKYYHWTTKNNYESIKIEGLKCNSGKSGICGPQPTYPHIYNKKSIIPIFLSDQKDFVPKFCGFTNKDEFICLEIEGTSLEIESTLPYYDFHCDIRVWKHEFICFNSIPPELITIVN